MYYYKKIAIFGFELFENVCFLREKTLKMFKICIILFTSGFGVGNLRPPLIYNLAGSASN